MVETGQNEIGPLKMVVCIKQVPLLSALRFDQETRRLVREGVPLELNELDVYALTEAIRLRERHGGEVIASAAWAGGGPSGMAITSPPCRSRRRSDCHDDGAATGPRGA